MSYDSWKTTEPEYETDDLPPEDEEPECSTCNNVGHVDNLPCGECQEIWGPVYDELLVGLSPVGEDTRSSTAPDRDNIHLPLRFITANFGTQ